MEENILNKIISTLNIQPSEYEREFIDVVIQGGKSDPSEKASIICCYFEEETDDNKKAIYELLTRHW